ncbi:hypothetical protein I4U23_011824 [Adineta vaga]|nr:hypothetical protein I4U23_011824 [Adineta vaga]
MATIHFNAYQTIQHCITMPTSSKIAIKNRLCFEIMVLTYRMDKLISQAPQGIAHLMTPAQLTQYNALNGQKQAMSAELYNLMLLDRDI